MFINTDNFKETTTLKEVAQSIREYLNMKKGQIELVIGFKYKKLMVMEKTKNENKKH